MTDYHDYVIKDGKFIGKFEEMYVNCDNPWYQREEADISYSRSDTINTINRFKLKKVVEVGCGLGFFTKRLSLGCPDSKIIGMDISETAIKKARERYPELSFEVGGVKELNSMDFFAESDAVLFAEILWYILDDLDDILSMLKNEFNGLLIVNQVFYNGGQKYGKEYFTNPEELIDYVKLPVLVKNVSIDSEHKSSYETHIVFDLRK